MILIILFPFILEILDYYHPIQIHIDINSAILVWVNLYYVYNNLFIFQLRNSLNSLKIYL